MDADCIKLTSYSGERRRGNGAFTGDALIDFYTRRQIAASISLRGIEGFGLKRQLRSDRSLSRSEDLPLTVTAVDTQPNIEGVLDQTLALNRSGLVTLERARLLWDEIEPVGIATNTGEATALTVYFGRLDTVYAVPAFEVMCELLHRRGVAGATVMLGVDGIAHGQRQRAQFFSRNSDSPMMVTAVGSADQIAMVLPELGDLLRRPVMTLERVRICKRDGQLIGRPEQAQGVDDHGFPLWQRLTVYTSEAAQHNGQPIHRAIVRRLRSVEIRGATTNRGIWGFHGDQPPHGSHFLQLGRHVPVVTTVVDTAERISAAFDVIDEITSERGLVINGTLAAARAASGQFQRLASTTPVPAAGDGPRRSRPVSAARPQAAYSRRRSR